MESKQHPNPWQNSALLDLWSSLCARGCTYANVIFSFYARPLHANRIPAMVICRESRAQALQDYPLSFSVDYKEPQIRFNFETDTLLLGRGLQASDKHYIFRSQCQERDLNRVKFVMVDAELGGFRNEWCPLWKRHTRLGSGLCNLLRNAFPAVKEHTVIYTAHTDPVSCKLYWQTISLTAADASRRVG
jgi:hypothetical protein